DAALEEAMISTHVLFGVSGGEFVSLLDPPADASAPARACDNQGWWPVLVSGTDTVLSSPIILYDHPQIAPESPGDLFDAAEIDEILSLRILTLTEEEKREAKRDPRARGLIERTEGLSAEQMSRLHGAIRELRPVAQPLQPGDRVRLRPQARVQVDDFGTRGLDLTYALLDGWDAAILVDALPRGGDPGTLYVLDPGADAAPPVLDPHAMHPARVLAMARELGGTPPILRVV